MVLQEQSRLSTGITIDNDSYFGKTDSFHEHLRLFNSEIEKLGAETVLFMTWSQREKPEEQVILTHAYASIANQINAILSPVELV